MGKRGSYNREAYGIKPPLIGCKKGRKDLPPEFIENSKTKRFVSKAEAEQDPEKMKQYQKQMEWCKKSAEVRKQKRMERKKMREVLEEMLATDYDLLQEWIQFEFVGSNKAMKTTATPDKAMDWFAQRGRNLTVQDAVILSVLKNAISKGDLRSIEFIRDTIGEKPKVEVETNANIKNVQGFTDLANSLFGKEEDKKDE